MLFIYQYRHEDGCGQESAAVTAHAALASSLSLGLGDSPSVAAASGSSTSHASGSITSAALPVISPWADADREFLMQLALHGPVFSDVDECDAWKQLVQPGWLRKLAREEKEREARDRKGGRTSNDVLILSTSPSPHPSSLSSSVGAGSALPSSASVSWPTEVDIEWQPIGLYQDKAQVETAIFTDHVLVVAVFPAAANIAAAVASAAADKGAPSMGPRVASRHEMSAIDPRTDAMQLNLALDKSYRYVDASAVCPPL